MESDQLIILLRKHALHQSRHAHIEGGVPTISLPWIDAKNNKSEGVAAAMAAGAGGGAYYLVVCASHLINDHAFLSRRRTVPTPFKIESSNIWVFVTCFPYIKSSCMLLFSPS